MAGHLFLIIVAAILYLAAGMIFGLRLFRRQNKPDKSWGLMLGFIAVLAHAILVYQIILSQQGWNLSFFNAVNLAAWIMSALYLSIALFKPVESLGMVLLPLAGSTLILDYLFPGVHLLPPHVHWSLRIHIIISMLAYSLLTMAALQAILLSIQDKKLHHHHPGGFIRALPPLQTMEDLLFEMIFGGFILLTIALLSGFIFLDNLFAQHLAHKTLLSIIAWFAFAILLWGRYRFGWRGRKAIHWTLGGFIFLALAYFGSKAVLELILHR